MTNHPDATLDRPRAAWQGGARGEIEFAGVPTSFTKEPYNVTFEVEKKKVAGWPGKEARFCGTLARAEPEEGLISKSVSPVRGADATWAVLRA